MAWIPPGSTDERYGQWPVETEHDVEFLGTSQRGKPIFYDRNRGHIYRGSIDENGERLVPDEEPTWELQPEETLGEFLERLGKDIGWESLTEFAREHLEHDVESATEE